MIALIFILAISIALIHALMGIITIPIQGSLIIDATGHALVCGIVLAFLVTGSLNTHILSLGGLISVFVMHGIIAILKKNNMLSRDSGTGIAFSFLFACGILLISLYARNVHLDLDMLLVGNIEFALHDGWFFQNVFMGPTVLWIIAILLFFFLIGLYFFWRPIKILLFDKDYFFLMGYGRFFIRPILVVFAAYATVVSLQAAGAIILVGLSASPLALHWNRVKTLESLFHNVLFSTFFLAILSTSVALKMDIPISATLSFFLSVTTLLYLTIAGEQSALAKYIRKKKQREKLLSDFLGNNNSEYKK